MRLLHVMTSILCLISSIQIEVISSAVFLPTPAARIQPKVPIIKRRKVKKKSKGFRQLSNESLDKLLKELELLPIPQELMQRTPDNSIIIRRKKKQRRKKNLQLKRSDVVKNVEQIQRDFSTQIREKRKSKIMAHSTTARSTSSTVFSSSTSKSLHRTYSPKSKAIKHLHKDSFVQETRTLTKYTPDHHIKPMVFFKQVTPTSIPSSSSASTPYFPHFPVRNVSTPPTFMTREPSSTIQFKKETQKTLNELRTNTHKPVTAPTSFWIAPTKHQGSLRSSPKSVKLYSETNASTHKPPVIWKQNPSSLPKSTKPTRLHRQTTTRNKPKEIKSSLNLSHRKRNKVVKNKSVQSLQTLSASTPSIYRSTPQATSSWSPKVSPESLKSIDDSPYSQPWTKLYPHKHNIKNNKYSSRDPEMSVPRQAPSLRFHDVKEKEKDRRYSLWSSTSSTNALTYSTTTKPSTRLASKPVRGISQTESQSEWIPYSKEDEREKQSRIPRGESHRSNKKSPIYFTQRPEGIPKVFQSHWDEESDISLKEAFASWNPPSFQNLEAEIYSSSWNNHNTPQTKLTRQNKVDPVWNTKDYVNPVRKVQDSHSRPSGIKNVQVRQIGRDELQGFYQAERRPVTWNAPPPRNNIPPPSAPSYGQSNKDWDVPRKYKKLLVYDPYTYKGNLNDLPSSSIESGQREPSTYIKPGPPYVQEEEEEFTQFVPEVVATSTVRPIVVPHTTSATTQAPFRPSDPSFPKGFEAPRDFTPFNPHIGGRSGYGRDIKNSDIVDYGAYSGSHGAFGWYADFPVAITH